MGQRMTFPVLLAAAMSALSIDFKAANGDPKATARLDSKARNMARRGFEAQGDIHAAIAHRRSPAQRAKLRARCR